MFHTDFVSDTSKTEHTNVVTRKYVKIRNKHIYDF